MSTYKPTPSALEFQEKFKDIMIWIKVQPNEDYTDAITKLFDASIQQAKQEMMKKLAEEIEKMSNDVYGHYEEFARQGFRRCKQRVLSSLQSL